MVIVGEEEMMLQGIKKRLVWHYCLVIFLTVLVLEGLFITALKQYYFGSAEQTLVNRATVSAAFYNKYLPAYPYTLKDKAKYILENIPKDETARIEIIDWQGNVIVDSNGFKPVEKIKTPDFQVALAGKTGIWNGKSEVTGERIMAVANPLKDGNRFIGVLRYVVSVEALYQAVLEITLVALLVGLLVVLLALALSLLLARSIITPMQEVTEVAEQMAIGNFKVKALKRGEDEVGKLADTLNFMAEEITKSDKMKNDFISSISHELRTPLTSIKGWGETILSGGMDDREETKQGLKIICKETDRMIGLVEELLDFSRFQSGRIQIHLEQVNVNKIIEEVRRQFIIRAKEKGIELVVNQDIEMPEITGDYNRLKQVFINLLDNALKFTAQNGRVQITTKRINDNVKIEVVDNGEGISPEDLPRISEKFYKGHINRPGSGLGLAIVKEIINLHQGKMYFESTLGQGTKVTVTLDCQTPKLMT